MSKDKNIAHWLRDWLAGDTNSEQDLRDAAKEDTFLADAMKGYEQFPESDHEASLKRLRGKLAQRTQGAKRRTIVWYLPRIAAAASVLLVSVWIINQNLKLEPSDIALNTPSAEAPIEESSDATLTEQPATVVPEEAEETLSEELTATGTQLAPVTPSSNYSADTGDKQDKEQLSAIIKEKQSVQQRARKPLKIDSEEAPIAAKTEPAIVPEIQPEPVELKNQDVLAEIPIAEEDSNAGAPALEEDAEDAAFALESREAEPAPPSPAPGGPRKLRGLITDTNGEPLIGVSIIEPGTNNGTMTNFDGQFDLRLQSNSKQVEIAYTGYETTILPIEGRSFVEVQLQEGVALDEVVVTSQGITKQRQAVSAMKTKESKKKDKSNFVSASKKFKRFVKKNQRYPQVAQDNKIEGEVIIEFDINFEGRPVNFKTVKSLGYGCDEEAIRLLKEGPEWGAGSEARGARGRVRFEFK